MLLAILVGGAIGAVAGFAVYAGKTGLRGERWSWKAAGAAAVGGLVGGAAFPPVMAGLAALGLAPAVAYALAGGIAWGGIWSLAQDAAGWALGTRQGLGRPADYATSIALGVLVSAALLPLASRAIGPGGLHTHGGSVEAYVLPGKTSVVANLSKAEGEFLAYGAATEGLTSGVRAAARAVPSLAERPERPAPAHAPRIGPLADAPPAGPPLAAPPRRGIRGALGGALGD